MKARKVCRTNNTKRIAGPQKPEPWIAWLTASRSLNHCNMEASGAWSLHKMGRAITTRLMLKIFRVNMAISFGIPTFALSNCQYQKKNCQKPPIFRIQDPKGFRGAYL